MTTSIVNGGAVIDGAGGGGASLPATPAEALLDAGNPLKLVYLDAGGAGAAVAFEDATDTGMSEIMSALAGGTATAGSYLSADGAGGLQLTAAPVAGLDAARPSASTATIGRIYPTTDTGVRYLCEGDGSGGTRWAVLGARGTEGRDTSAVSASPSCVGTTSASVLSSTAVSGAITFSFSSPPGSAVVLASILSGSGWQVQIGNNAGDRYELSVFRSGFGTTTVALGTITSSPTTVHCLAWTFDGTNTRWSLDGSAAATASHVSGTATTSTTPVRIAGNSGGFGATFFYGGMTLWSTSVGNADLAAVTTAGRAAGTTPGRIAAVTGATELFRHHSAQVVAATTAPQLLGGSIGGTISWSAAPTVTIR